MKSNLGFGPYLFDISCLTIFGYLLFDSLMVIRLGGPFSRIDLLHFLIPHASKVAAWSLVAILWWRREFGWRFPFAMLFTYCVSELLTNSIWMGVHLPEGYHFPLDNGLTTILGMTFPTTEGIFLLSSIFFILGIIFSFIFLKRHLRFQPDWSMLPFAVFVLFWIATGYQTESTIANPSYWLETEEFIWNILYLFMAINVFRPKSKVLPILQERPFVG